VTRKAKTTLAPVVEFGALEALWLERARRVAAVRRRANPAGMRRPPRDPDERAWLAERGRLGPFVEAAAPGRLTAPGD
jgi:hypothetical protein